MPERPHTTAAREKLKLAASIAHPMFTMKGSPCSERGHKAQRNWHIMGKKICRGSMHFTDQDCLDAWKCALPVQHPLPRRCGGLVTELCCNKLQVSPSASFSCNAKRVEISKARQARD